MSDPRHDPISDFIKVAEAIERAHALEELFRCANGDRGRSAYSAATAVSVELQRHLLSAAVRIAGHAV